MMRRYVLQLKFFVLIIIAIALFLPLAGAQAQTRPSLSTDEFLEYSLESLKSKMSEAVKENRLLSEKNTSMRNRVLFLREEARGMDEELIQLKEKAADLRNAIRLDAEELKLEEKQFNNSLERKRHLEFERDLIKKRMDTIRLERNLIEKDVNDISFDLREFKSPAKKSGTSQLLNFFVEEKLKFVDMLKGYQIRITEKKNKADAEELAIAGYLRAKETALREKESLQRQISELELRLKEEEARAMLLSRDAERRQGDARARRLAVERENLDKKEYRKQLRIVIDDMNVKQKDFQAGFAREEKSLKGYLALLKDENQELFSHHKILEDQERLLKTKESEGHTTVLVADQEKVLSDQKRNMMNEINKMRDALAEQQNINASLARDEERLKKELKDLTDRVGQVKESGSVIRKDVFGQKRTVVDEELKNQIVRTQDLIKEKDAAETVLEQQKQDLLAQRDKGSEMERILSENQKALQNLEEDRKTILQAEKDLSIAYEGKVAALKKNIDDARLYKKAIGASYDVIQQKYQSGEYERASFDVEAEKLDCYLNVLQKENAALSKRLAELKKRDEKKSDEGQGHVTGDGL